jgi:signal transduction histidine kinase
VTWSDLARRWKQVWPLQVPPLASDLVIVGATCALQVLSLVLARPSNWPLAILIGLLQVVPLRWRRRWPLAVLAVLVAANSVEWLSGVHFGGYLVAVPATIYSVAYRSGRVRWLLFSALLLYALYSAVDGVVQLHRATAIDAAFAGVFGCAVFLMGENARVRAAHLAELEARLARQERDREEDRRRAAEAERLRIARELHDVVAHHVSAIAVDATAERAVRPDDVGAEAMSRIAVTARLALTELGQLLGVLRRETGERAPRAPEPGLEQAQELVAQARAAGLDVSLAVSGAPRTLPSPLDLSAYRILQEAITNARKHAVGARVEVCIRYAADRLEIRVTDDGTGGQARPAWRAIDATGHGLIGMRERVEVFGGRFHAGPLPAGGFLVSADLPIEPPR